MKQSRSIRFLFSLVILLAVAIVLGGPVSARAEIASGTMGTVSWRIDDDGVLVIKPQSGNEGTFPQPTGNEYQDAATTKSYWKWNPYREQIKRIKVEGTIKFPRHNNSQNARAMSWMFADCTNLQKVEEGDLAGLEFEGTTSLARMFSGCTSLTEADLGDVYSPGIMSNMQNMFNGCTSLEKVIFDNPNFETRATDATGTGNGLINGINGMFANCTNLKYVDMSNLKLHFRVNDTSVKSQFSGKSNLETVIMHDTVMDGVRDLSGAFSGCASLTTVEMTSGNVSDHTVFPDAVAMTNMFAGSFTDPTGQGTPTLDVSGFGKLGHIVNMDGFVNGCTGLMVLNISNLDNSRIQPINDKHLAREVDQGAAAINVDWGRELGVETCTSLEWILAEKSKVWMVKNQKGVPGSEYFSTPNDEAIYYFTDKQMEFCFSGQQTVAATIETYRDYIDMLHDREEDDPGNKNKANNINQQTNPASDGGYTGAGILPAGNFHILGSGLTNQDPPHQDTYYRIGNLENSTPTVTIEPAFVSKFRHDETNGRIDTLTKDDWPASGNVVYADGGSDPVITLFYPAAAVDVNGKYHDVIVKINKITFTNLGSIPTSTSATGSARVHDGNRYVDTTGGGKYCRPILNYGTGKLGFLNYIYVSNAVRLTMLKGDSGTEIDFTIEIKDALPDTSVCFFVDDLDVPASQEYTIDAADACYDLLTWKGTHYGEYTNTTTGTTARSEGIILGDGNDVNTIQFAAHTGMTSKVLTGGGTYVYGTGSDPSSKSDTNKGSTGWSGFSVKANADKAYYTWTSGIGCTTELLRETPEVKLDPVVIKPEGIKAINGLTPWGQYDHRFMFELVPAWHLGAGPREDVVEYEYMRVDDGNGNSNTPVRITALLDDLAGYPPYDQANIDTRAITQSKFNYVDKIKFDELKFYHPLSTKFDDANGMTGANHTDIPAGRQYAINFVGDEYQNSEFPDPSYSSTFVLNGGDRGYNEHIANAYIYRIQEVDVPDNDVEYNTAHVAYFLRVIVSNPKNDLEMSRGVKAEVTLGRYYAENNARLHAHIEYDDIEWDTYTQTVWSNDNGETAKRQQAPWEVSLPSDPSKTYSVKADVNGVEYVKVAAADYYNDPTKTGDVYLDANNLNGLPLIEMVAGVVYPYAEQTPEHQLALGYADPTVTMPKEKNGQTVKMDVHGNEYIGGPGAYQSPDGGALTVEDGVFNPDTTDRTVFVEKEINGFKVLRDALGNEYYTDGNGGYYLPDGSAAAVGRMGNVTPRDADKAVTRDKTDDEQLIVTHTDGQGYPVFETSNGIKYYQVGNSYYSLVGTSLTATVDGFNPQSGDNPYKAAFDIFVDDQDTSDESDDVLYYKSDGAYYTLSGDPYTPRAPVAMTAAWCMPELSTTASMYPTSPLPKNPWMAARAKTPRATCLPIPSNLMPGLT